MCTVPLLFKVAGHGSKGYTHGTIVVHASSRKTADIMHRKHYGAALGGRQLLDGEATRMPTLMGEVEVGVNPPNACLLNGC